MNYYLLNFKEQNFEAKTGTYPASQNRDKFRHSFVANNYTYYFQNAPFYTQFLNKTFTRYKHIAMIESYGDSIVIHKSVWDVIFPYSKFASNQSEVQFYFHNQEYSMDYIELHFCSPIEQLVDFQNSSFVIRSRYGKKTDEAVSFNNAEEFFIKQREGFESNFENDFYVEAIKLLGNSSEFPNFDIFYSFFASGIVVSEPLKNDLKKLKIKELSFSLVNSFSL